MARTYKRDARGRFAGGGGGSSGGRKSSATKRTAASKAKPSREARLQRAAATASRIEKKRWNTSNAATDAFLQRRAITSRASRKGWSSASAKEDAAGARSAQALRSAQRASRRAEGLRTAANAAARSKPPAKPKPASKPTARRGMPKTTSARGRALQNQRRAAALVSASRGGRGPSAKAVRSVLTAQRARAFYAATGGGKKRSAVKPAAKKSAKATAAAVRARTKAFSSKATAGRSAKEARKAAKVAAKRDKNAQKQRAEQRALRNYTRSNNALQRYSTTKLAKTRNTAHRAVAYLRGAKMPSKLASPAASAVRPAKKAKSRSTKTPKQTGTTAAPSNAKTRKSASKAKNNKGPQRAAKNYLLALKEVMGPAGGRKRKRVLTGKAGRRLATAARALDHYLGAGKQRTRASIVADRIARILRIADKVRKSQSRASRLVGLSREALASRLTEKAARLARGPRLSRIQRDIAMDAKREYGIKSTGRKRR